MFFDAVHIFMLPRYTLFEIGLVEMRMQMNFSHKLIRQIAVVDAVMAG